MEATVTISLNQFDELRTEHARLQKDIDELRDAIRNFGQDPDKLLTRHRGLAVDDRNPYDRKPNGPFGKF